MSTEIFYSNNPVDWTALEALYINELKPPGFISGVNLSTTGIAGQCVRGPLTPQEITSPARFVELYGERDFTAKGTGPLVIGQIWAALLNKKFGKVIGQRVLAAAAVKATVNLSNAVPTAIIRVDASNPGVWGNGATGGLTVSVETATDADANHFNLRAKYLGKEYLFANLNTFTANDDNLLQTIGDDPAVLITVTKLANGRPVNVTDSPLASGAEGTIAQTDYDTAATALANYSGIATIIVPEALTGTTPAPNMAGMNAKFVTLASTVKDRCFLTWSGVVGQSVSTNKTAKTTQITTVSDRLLWCYNATKTVDPKSGLKIDQGPHVWMACLRSQFHPSVHLGSDETRELLAGIDSVYNDSLTRQDLIDLRAAGITTLEHIAEEGFKFHSVVTTDTTPGLTEFTRRVMTDFLQISAGKRLKSFPKSKNTKKQRAKEMAELIAFSEELQKEGPGQTIDDDDPDLGPGYLVDKKSVNTGAQRSKGLEFTLWRVRLIGHELYLVLQTEVGTGVVTVVG